MTRREKNRRDAELCAAFRARVEGEGWCCQPCEVRVCIGPARTWQLRKRMWGQPGRKAPLPIVVMQRPRAWIMGVLGRAG